MCNKIGTPSTDAKVAGAEIDIFESPYYDINTSPNPDKTDNYQCAIHVGDYGSESASYTNDTWMSFLRKDKSKDIKIYGDWHVFALDWQEDYYRFYYDGTLLWDTDFKNNVSNQDSFLFLSVEIGGSNGIAGETPFLLGGDAITTNEEGVLPQDFKIDYVRVYDVKPA